MANCVQCGRKLPGLTLGKKLCQWCKHHEAVRRGEIDEDAPQPVVAAPWVRRGESTITLTQIIFGANVAVFLAMALASGSALDFPGETMVHFGANYGPYTLSGQWWRLFSYMFLHGGIMHIAFNMWCLWDLGALSESLYGRWTFAAIYLITGVAGGIASVGWNPGVLTVGASGAIFGLAGALLASFYLGEFSRPRIAIQGTLRSLAFFVGFNVLFGAGINVFGGGSTRVDNAAHIGGLASGMILGALIARLAPQPDAPLRRLSVVAVVALAVLGSALGVQRWRGGPMRFGMALESLSHNKPDQAIQQLQALVRQQPNSVQPHIALGQAYFQVNKYPQAESEFKRALELQPQLNGVRLQLGMIYLSEKRPDEARSAFTQVLSQSPNSSNSHYGLAMALAMSGMHKEAVDEYNAAIRLGQQSSGIYYELGQSYSKLKMYDDAIAAYQKEKETGGDDPDLATAIADAQQAKQIQQGQDNHGKPTPATNP